MAFYVHGRQNFISLLELLGSIANTIDMPPHFEPTTKNIGKISIDAHKNFWDKVRPEIERARCLSFAAQQLNMALHDVSQNPLIVLEYDETMGFPVQTEIARNECIELLKQVIGWGNRRYNSIGDHFRNSITLGDNALSEPILVMHMVEVSKIFTIHNIGFNRGELITFLNNKGISHTFEPQPEAVEDVGLVSHTGTETNQKPLTKLQEQQAAILEVIKQKKFNPMAIPDGEKSNTIQRICENNYAILFNGSTSFDRAWKKGLECDLWRMKNHVSYAKRGL